MTIAFRWSVLRSPLFLSLGARERPWSSLVTCWSRVPSTFENIWEWTSNFKAFVPFSFLNFPVRFPKMTRMSVDSAEPYDRRSFIYRKLATLSIELLNIFGHVTRLFAQPGFALEKKQLKLDLFVSMTEKYKYYMYRLI